MTIRTGAGLPAVAPYLDEGELYFDEAAGTLHVKTSDGTLAAVGGGGSPFGAEVAGTITLDLSHYNDYGTSTELTVVSRSCPPEILDLGDVGVMQTPSVHNNFGSIRIENVTMDPALNHNSVLLLGATIIDESNDQVYRAVPTLNNPGDFFQIEIYDLATGARFDDGGVPHPIQFIGKVVVVVLAP